MSFMVVHMDKFKKEAVRGIQSHNTRERESHSNPDIDYERSEKNYELHDSAPADYSKAIQNRIDDLMLVKSVRKDAVHMCGVIVSSDNEFFKTLSPQETKRFFEESKEFLTKFVGKENIVSAMVHMDEKTPHMHFLHVPVTPDGRLSAKNIYTRESLKNLQTELPAHLQRCGFNIERGIEQTPNSAKKHLNTKEFKQQKEMLNSMQQESQALKISVEQGRQQESVIQERIEAVDRLAQDAEQSLLKRPSIPQASMFNYKAALKTASGIIEKQNKALSNKAIIAAQNETLRGEVSALNGKIIKVTAEKELSESRHRDETHKLTAVTAAHEKDKAALDELREFISQPEIQSAYNKHLFKKQEEARKQEIERERKRAEYKEFERRFYAVQERREAEKRQKEAQEAEQRKKQSRDRGMSR